MNKIKQIFRKNKLLFISLGIAIVLINILFFPSTDSQVLIAIIFYWLAMGFIYQFNEKFFFALAMVFLVLTPVPFLSGNMLLAERFSVWEFLFIILGLWQWFFLQLKRKNK